MTTGLIGVPSATRIRSRLTDQEDPFHIDPEPDHDRVGSGTVDLRLGRTFLVAARGSMGTINVSEAHESRRLFSEIRLTGDEVLVVHPQQLVLAATLEYISMPDDLAGFVQSRSSYGRLGLIATTATYVAAGYQGSPTLEIVNAGEIPLALRAGDRVCHIVLMAAEEGAEKPPVSRYQCSTRPYPPLVRSRRP
jgi:dCTP deaminase